MYFGINMNCGVQYLSNSYRLIMLGDLNCKVECMPKADVIL